MENTFDNPEFNTKTSLDPVVDGLTFVSDVMAKNFGKFADILSSIDRNIEAMHHVSQNAIKDQLEQEERKRTQDQLDQLERDRRDRAERDTGATESGLNKTGSAIASFGHGLFAGAMVFKDGMLGAGLAALISPIVGKFVMDFTEQSLKNLGVDNDLAKSFGDSAGLASVGGLVGRAFGKKWGLVGAAAGAAFTFGDEVLDAAGIDKDQLINVLGFEIKASNMVGGVMSAVAGGASFALQNPAVWKAGGNAALTSMQFLGSMGLLRAGVAGGIAMMYLAYGDEAVAWLQENAGMSEGGAQFTTDAGSFITMGAFLGSQFGPVGMIVGALAGLALSVGKGIYDWLERKEEAEVAAVKEKLDADWKKWESTTAGLVPGTPIPQAVAEQARVISTAGLTDEVLDNMSANRADEVAPQIARAATADKIILDGLALKSVFDAENITDLINTAIYENPRVKAAADLTRTEGAYGLDGTKDNVGDFFKVLFEEYPAAARASIDELQEGLANANQRILDSGSYKGFTEIIDFGNYLWEKDLIELQKKYRVLPVEAIEGLSPKGEELARVSDQRNSTTVVATDARTSTNVNIVQGGTNVSTMFSGGGSSDRRDNAYGLPNNIGR